MVDIQNGGKDAQPAQYVKQTEKCDDGKKPIENIIKCNDAAKSYGQYTDVEIYNSPWFPAGCQFHNKKFYWNKNTENTAQNSHDPNTLRICKTDSEKQSAPNVQTEQQVSQSVIEEQEANMMANFRDVCSYITNPNEICRGIVAYENEIPIIDNRLKAAARVYCPEVCFTDNHTPKCKDEPGEEDACRAWVVHNAENNPCETDALNYNRLNRDKCQATCEIVTGREPGFCNVTLDGDDVCDPPLDPSCFDGYFYTCSNCCKGAGKANDGITSCWDDNYTKARCCH